jgi:hypothetical protein
VDASWRASLESPRQRLKYHRAHDRLSGLAHVPAIKHLETVALVTQTNNSEVSDVSRRHVTSVHVPR